MTHRISFVLACGLGMGIWVFVGACGAAGDDSAPDWRTGAAVASGGSGGAVPTGGGAGGVDLPGTGGPAEDAGTSASTDAPPDTAAPDAAPDVDFTYDAPPRGPQDACANLTVEAQLQPLDMYLMVDRSGSMSGGKWESQRDALAAFFLDPGSRGITAAIRFFPYGEYVSPNCDGSYYRAPLDPPGWGVLPDHAPALVDAIDDESPEGSFTPTGDALRGLVEGAYDRQIAFPDHVVVAVIVSDGYPESSCTNIGSVARQYFEGTPSIRTFSIFVESVASGTMTEIAQQGGTGSAYDATSGTSAFVTALQDIMGEAIPCEFDVPRPDTGSVDWDRLTVVVESGLDTSTIPRVPDAASCGSVDGWYYDDDSDPTQILLCPTTCSTMQADPDAKLSIATGCLGA